jgi:hypothetical protein
MAFWFASRRHRCVGALAQNVMTANRDPFTRMVEAAMLRQPFVKA